MFFLKKTPLQLRRLAMLSLFLIPPFASATTSSDTQSVELLTSPVAIESDFFSELQQSAPVPLDRLASLRGGTEVVNNEQKLNGVVTQNTAENVVSGANTISNGAFTNASGIPIVIQNSGANVLIQNATVINLQIK